MRPDFVFMEKILIGKIVAASGLKGEVKAYNYAQSVERFGKVSRVILSKGGSDTVYDIEKVRYQNGMAVLKLKGVNDRDRAEAIRESMVYITEEDLEELPEGMYYVKDMIGLKVVDTGLYGEVGTVKDVLQNTSQDVYVVKTPSGREIMIPAVKEFIKDIDIKGGVLTVALIPGFGTDEELR